MPRPSHELPPDPKALDDPHIRRRYVTAMFDVVATRYDRFTRWFSFGMDAGWKRDLIAWINSNASETRVAVDLGCGTGDLTFGVAAKTAAALVVGLDASRPMLRLAVARQRDDQATGRVIPQRIYWCAGDLCRLPFPDASVDLVTAGYAVRNAASWLDALDEIARVLKPGAVMLSLDFFKPPNRLWRRLFLSYLRTVGLAYGWAWHRAPAVYGYIAPSIARFATAREFATALESRGLTVDVIDVRLGGGIALHVARRDGSR